MRFRNTKQNLRNLCNLRMIAYEALLFPRCVSYSLDLAFLAILFPPLSFICVNLRFVCVFIRVISRFLFSVVFICGSRSLVLIDLLE
jgi:hypothetical protein